MFTRKICVAFLTLALSSLTAQAAPTFPQFPDVCGNNGSQVKTITQTVTVTAAPPAQTSGNVAIQLPGGGNNNGGNNNSGSNNSNNSNDNNNNGGGKNNTGGSKGNNGGSGTNNGGSQNNNSGSGNNGGNNNNSGNNNTSGSNNNNGGSGNNNGGNNNSTDAQSSLTLDPKVIATGFENNGQDVPAAGQVASLTSSNNFINFCLTVPNLPITNGKQITTGSCNPAPIGSIPSVDNMPSSKFSSPPNFGAVKTNTAFTIKMQIQNMQTGFFVNAAENYFAAPQQLNGQGQITGHSHVVIEQLSAIDQTTTTDPQKFAFFKGLNDAAANGVLTADVTNGLPAGAYKLSSINAAANHQPVIVPVAQHGSLDDSIYFFVTDDGKPPANSPFGNSNSNAIASSSVAASSTAAASASASATAVSSVASSASSLAADSSAAAPSASATGKGSKGNAQSTTAAASKGGKGDAQPTATAATSGKAGASAEPTTTTAAGKAGGAPAASASASTTPGSKGDSAANGGNKDNSKDNSGDNSGDNSKNGTPPRSLDQVDVNEKN